MPKVKFRPTSKVKFYNQGKVIESGTVRRTGLEQTTNNMTKPDKSDIVQNYPYGNHGRSTYVIFDNSSIYIFWDFKLQVI